MSPVVSPRMDDSHYEIHIDPTVVMEHWRSIKSDPKFFFQSPEWITSLIGQTGDDSILISFTDHDQPVLVTHLLKSTFKRFNVGLKIISAPGSLSGFGLFADGLFDKGFGEVALADIVANAGAWHVLRLERLRLGSPWLTMKGVAGKFEDEPSQGVGVLDTNRDPETWRNQLPKNMRHSVAKARARAERVGGVSIETETGLGVLDAFNQYVALEATQKKGLWGSSLSQKPRNLRLLRDYLTSVETSQVRRLFIDGRLAACQLSVVVNRTLFLLNIAYDEKQAHLSPGNLLMADLVESCCKDPSIDRIDCTVWQPWHQRWGMVREPTFTFTAFNSRSIKGRAVGIAWPLRRYLLKQ